MKKISCLSFGAACAVIFWFSGASAQEQLPLLPVELFICNFQDGSDFADLQGASDDFNEWADANGLADLTTYMLTPVFYSGELTADVIGMNIWNSGAAMGDGSASIVADEDSVAAYNEILDCGAHQLFVLAGTKPPSEGLIDDGSLFQFTNCTLRDNRNGGDGIQAARVWGNATAEAGITDAQALLFPAAGESSQADYSFKWITVVPSIEAFGRSIDQFLNGGLLQTRANIMRDLATCDSQRIYNTIVVREANA